MDKDKDIMNKYESNTTPNQQDEVKCNQQSEQSVTEEKPAEKQNVEVFVTGLAMFATTL